MNAAVALARYLAEDEVENVIDSWKMSNDDARQLRWMVAHRNDYVSVDNAVYQIAVGNDTRQDWVNYFLYHDRGDLAQWVQDYEFPEFPVNGNDLIEAGHKPGPQFGANLKRLREIWADGYFAHTKEELMAMIANQLENK